MKARTKKIVLFCYLGLVFTVTLVLAISLTKEGQGFFSVIGSINPLWFLCALACMTLYLFIESFAVWYITSFMYKKMGYFYILKMDLIGNYYGAITPAAFGFQPSQIAYMKRDGVPVGISTFIQTIKLMAYELVIVFLCIVFMSIRGAFFYDNYPQIFWISIFGALVNIFVITMMVIAIVQRNALKKMVMGITKFLAKLHIVKRFEKMRVTVEKNLDDFHDSSTYIIKYKWKILKACGLTLIQWLMFFAIPYCLYNAFGGRALNPNGSFALNTASSLDEAVSIMAMAAFLFLAVHFIPIPGSSGATEMGFGLFFGNFFAGFSAVAMFIWRLITYYSIIVIGFVIILVDGVSHKGKKENNEQLPSESPETT